MIDNADSGRGTFASRMARNLSRSQLVKTGVLRNGVKDTLVYCMEGHTDLKVMGGDTDDVEVADLINEAVVKLAVGQGRMVKVLKKWPK